MTKDRNEDVARILGGKRSRKLIRAHLAGTLNNTHYELTYGTRSVTERAGLLGRKEVTRRQRVHQYRLDFEWLDQPVRIERTSEGLEVIPALRSELPRATLKQQVVLADAYVTWPNLVATNMGYEVTIDDRKQTAQELAVVLQALEGSLSSLAPPEPEIEAAAPLSTRIRAMVDRIRPEKS